MAIGLKKKIGNHALLGVWEIEESEQELIKNLNITNSDLDFLNTISHPKRRIEWLASRVLLRKLIEELYPFVNLKVPINIQVDKNGKPTLQNLNYHFSLSHSDKMASAIVSKTSPVGIDIEKIQPKIENIAPKFMNENEYKNLKGKSDKTKILYIHWCAKEAAYKLIGKKGLIFSKDIILEHIDYPQKNQLIVKVNDSDTIKKLNGFYKIIKGYMLVYTLTPTTPKGIPACAGMA